MRDGGPGGSRARKTPCAASLEASAPSGAPAPTVTTRSAGLKSDMVSSRLVERISASAATGHQHPAPPAVDDDRLERQQRFLDHHRQRPPQRERRNATHLVPGDFLCFVGFGEVRVRHVERRRQPARVDALVAGDDRDPERVARRLHDQGLAHHLQRPADALRRMIGPDFRKRVLQHGELHRLRAKPLDRIGVGHAVAPKSCQPRVDDGLRSRRAVRTIAAR